MAQPPSSFDVTCTIDGLLQFDVKTGLSCQIMLEWLTLGQKWLGYRYICTRMIHNSDDDHNWQQSIGELFFFFFAGWFFMEVQSKYQLTFDWWWQPIRLDGHWLSVILRHGQYQSARLQAPHIPKEFAISMIHRDPMLQKWIVTTDSDLQSTILDLLPTWVCHGLTTLSSSWSHCQSTELAGPEIASHFSGRPLLMMCFELQKGAAISCGSVFSSVYLYSENIYYAYVPYISPLWKD